MTFVEIRERHATTNTGRGLESVDFHQSFKDRFRKILNIVEEEDSESEDEETQSESDFGYPASPFDYSRCMNRYIRGPEIFPIVASIGENAYVLHGLPIMNMGLEIMEPAFEMFINDEKEENGGAIVTASRWESLPPPPLYQSGEGQDLCLRGHCIIGNKLVAYWYDGTTCTYDCHLLKWMETELLLDMDFPFSLATAPLGFPYDGQCASDLSCSLEEGHNVIVFFSMQNRHRFHAYLVDKDHRVVCYQNFKGMFSPLFDEEYEDYRYYQYHMESGKVINVGNDRMCAVVLGNDPLENCILYICIFRLSKLTNGPLPKRKEGFSYRSSDIQIDGPDHPMHEEFLALDIEEERIYNVNEIDSEPRLFRAFFI